MIANRHTAGSPFGYLSRPGVCLPTRRYSNDDVIGLVRENYGGPPKRWRLIESGIRRVFKACNTQVRYLDLDPSSRVARYAATASERCLEKNRASVDDIDLIIYAGIAREYFEPATAMEVAQILGMGETHAFDLTTACVGQLEAVQAACAYLNLYDHYRTALVCTAELTRDYLSFDIQSTDDLRLKSAGLTIGNAASAMLVGKQPWPGGCVALRSVDTYSLPRHWALCQVPIRGTFVSDSVELMKLHEQIVPQLKTKLLALGWNARQINHIVFHQPSEAATRRVVSGIGADLERGVYTHHLYGNNASATIGVAFDHLLQEREIAKGDQILFGSAAGGFSMVTMAGEWMTE